MNLLIIPLILVGAFILPFAMAWLEPKSKPASSPRTNAARTLSQDVPGRGEASRV